MELVAYSCRYGHIGLAEALNCDRLFLARFSHAVGKIIEQENRPRK